MAVVDPVPSEKAPDELKAVYDQPLPELLFRAAEVHRAHHDVRDIQRCALLSIKTGGCPEDCGYCPQSAAYDAPVGSMPLLSVAEVKERATRAKELGATSFLTGAADNISVVVRSTLVQVLTPGYLLAVELVEA